MGFEPRVCDEAAEKAEAANGSVRRRGIAWAEV